MCSPVTEREVISFTEDVMNNFLNVLYGSGVEHEKSEQEWESSTLLPWTY